MRVAICALGVLLWAASPAAATTFYVSTTGSNANSCATAATAGSDATLAKRNIQDGVACLQSAGAAGDSVMIYGGTYTSASDVVDTQAGGFTLRSGTDFGAGVITIGCKSGSGTCVMKPPAGIAPLRFTSANVSYIVIQDLEVDLSNQPDYTPPEAGGSDPFPPEALYVSCCSHHMKFLRMHMHHSMSGAVQFSTSGDADGAYDGFLEIRDSNIHDYGLATYEGIQGGGLPGVNNGYGIYTFISEVTLEGNSWHDGHGIGINAYGTNVTIKDNHVYNNGIVRGGTVFGISICSDSYYNPGTLAQLPCTGLLLANNVVHDNQGGVQIYNGATSTKVYNNTIVNNVDIDNFLGVGLHLQYCTTPLVRNNLLYGNETDYLNSGPSCTATCAYNLIPSNPGACSNTVTAAPTFVDAASDNYKLASGSEGIDDGTDLSADLTTDYDGLTRSAPFDIGAYEFTSASVMVTTTLAPGGQRTAAYTTNIFAAGGTGTFASCSVSAGTQPTGLSVTIAANTCVLSGTPSAVGSYSFTVEVCDNAGSPVCDTQPFDVAIIDVTSSCSTSTSGGWTLRGCPGAVSSNGTANAVTSAIDSSSADLAVCGLSFDNAITPPTLSDSKSNTWTLISSESSTFGEFRLYYSRLASVGSGHTFTAATGGATSYPGLRCLVFSGSDPSPLHNYAGASDVGVSVLGPGTIATSATEELIIVGVELEALDTVALDGYTVYQTIFGSLNFGTAMGWKVIVGAVPNNPVWEWVIDMDAATVGASFYEAVPPSGVFRNSTTRLRLRRR